MTLKAQTREPAVFVLPAYFLYGTRKANEAKNKPGKGKQEGDN